MSELDREAETNFEKGKEYSSSLSREAGGFVGSLIEGLFGKQEIFRDPQTGRWVPRKTKPGLIDIIKQLSNSRREIR